MSETPSTLVADVFDAMAMDQIESGDECNSRAKSISELRKKAHEKGLAFDGSREALIAVLEKQS